MDADERIWRDVPFLVGNSDPPRALSPSATPDWRISPGRGHGESWRKRPCQALRMLRVAIRRVNPGRADELREWLAEVSGPRREEALATLVDEGCTTRFE